MGDEGHNRNKAGSLLYLKLLAPQLARPRRRRRGRRRGAEVPRRQRALGAQSGDGGLQGDGRRRARRRGLDHRLGDGAQRHRLRHPRLAASASAGSPRPSTVPHGLYFPGFGRADANPDIGDSTITETAGHRRLRHGGGAGHRHLHRRLAADARAATLEMYEITAAEHPAFKIPALGFRGTPVGIDLRKVVELGISAARQHRHRAPRGRRRADRRRPGPAADGDFRAGAGGVRGGYL